MRAPAVHPSGRLFYALNEDSYNVSVYAMNPTTGLLTLLKNVQTGADPADIKVHLNGRFAYVTERQGGGSPSVTERQGGGSPSTTSHTLRLTPLGAVGTRSGPAAVITFTSPALWLSVNETLFRRETTMTLTTATTPGSTPQVVDLYVALQLPD
jgi:DNA-binding beta-propeller fold protein YncE